MTHPFARVALRKKPIVLQFLFALCLLQCHRAPSAQDGGAHEDPRAPLSFTDWSGPTELFVEFRTLVRGMDSPMAAHVTVLNGFRPLERGTVTAVLSGNGPEERFSADRASVPGIFRPIVRPSRAGRARLRIEIVGAAERSTHDLGEIDVLESAPTTQAPGGDDEAGRITFLKEQQWVIEFATTSVEQRAIRPSIVAFAEVSAPNTAAADIVAPVAGRLSARARAALGAVVRSGELLTTLATRPEGSADAASLDLAAHSARAELARASRETQRITGLIPDGAAAMRELEAARRDEAIARASLTAAQRRLAAFERVQGVGRGGGDLRVRSPIDGVVVAAHAQPGAYVEAGALLFRVVDLSQLALDVQVPEHDAAMVSRARGLWFEVNGAEGVTAVEATELLGSAPLIDVHRRTLTVRYALPAAARALAIGTHCVAHLYSAESELLPAVPLSAVVDDAGTPVVFVQVEGEAFERRVVRLGARERGLVAVRSGVRAGEHVVSRGAFAVKLAASSGSIPAHGHSH